MTPVEEGLPEKSKQVIVKLENGWHTCTWITGDGTFALNNHKEELALKQYDKLVSECSLAPVS